MTIVHKEEANNSFYIEDQNGSSEVLADDENSGIGGSRIDYFAKKFSSLQEQ